MASPAQVTANRANAQSSTGPRSVEGKSAASRNSLKLGIHAQSMIIPGEDPADLDQLTLSYEQKFQPVGPIESSLLETIIRAAWMQRRYARIEAEYLTSRLAALPEGTAHPLGAVMTQDAAAGNTLQKIFRRQQAAQRDWSRALETLSLIQTERFRFETQALTASAPSTSSPNRVRFDMPPLPTLSDLPELPVNLALRL
jgi:hypothetical protein